MGSVIDSCKQSLSIGVPARLISSAAGSLRTRPILHGRRLADLLQPGVSQTPLDARPFAGGMSDPAGFFWVLHLGSGRATSNGEPRLTVERVPTLA